MGLLLMVDGKRRTMLQTGFEKLLETILSGRILPLDLESAEAASKVAAAQKRRSVDIDLGDHQIAGIALANRATLATRNTKHFEGLGTILVNPWTDQAQAPTSNCSRRADAIALLARISASAGSGNGASR